TGLDPKVTAAAVDRRSYTPLPIDAKVVSTEQEMWDAFKAQEQVTADVDLRSYFSTQFNAVVAKATATAEKDNT
ncbi:MAG: hypothetical protein JWR42_2973, partial [Marmoricola sp.]|nr:hypothetical protein [Marmoricola sp.]